jgi:hypothetical protein
VISNSDDVIDIRDVITRGEELEGDLDVNFQEVVSAGHGQSKSKALTASELPSHWRHTTADERNAEETGPELVATVKNAGLHLLPSFGSSSAPQRAFHAA